MQSQQDTANANSVKKTTIVEVLDNNNDISFGAGVNNQVSQT